MLESNEAEHDLTAARLTSAFYACTRESVSPPEYLDAQVITGIRLCQFLREETLSPSVMDAWKLHIQCNRRHRMRESIDGLYNIVTPYDKHRGGRFDAVERFIAHNPIRILPSLGPYFRAMFFTGPAVNTILLAEDVPSDVAETTFQLLDLFMHLCHGHLKASTYDFMFELRRDIPVPDYFLTPEYGEAEHIARKAACCLWDNGYTDSALSRSFVSAALKHGIESTLIREAVSSKTSLRQRLRDSIMDTSLGMYLRRIVHRPPLYKGPIGLVQAEGRDPNVYLLCRARDPRTGGEIVWRRWVPSDSVILRLGLTPSDVVRIGPQELFSTTMEGPLLIDLHEVAEYRNLLERTVVHRLLHFGLGTKSLLEGIYRRGSEGRANGASKYDDFVPAPAQVDAPFSVMPIYGVTSST